VVDRAAGIVCDAKSGVSGAGRKPRLKSSFCEVTENFSAYSILRHRHVPEVLQISGLEEANSASPPSFCRSTAGSSRPSISGPPASPAPKNCCVYETRYAGEPFLRIYQPGHCARPACRGAHQLLRHRRRSSTPAAAARWW
jgi:N-acetyl-gamma-glutamyl-phosphate reductase